MSASSVTGGHGSRHFSRWVRFGLPFLILFLLWLFYKQVPILFSSMMISWGLYYILNPAVDFLETHSLRRVVASAIVLLGVSMVLYLVWLSFLAFSSDFRQSVDVDKFQSNLVGTTKKLVEWSEEKVPILKRFIEPESHAPAPVPAPPVETHSRRGKGAEHPGPEHTLKIPEGTIVFTASRSAPPATLEKKIEDFMEGIVTEWGPQLALKLASLLPNLILIPYFTFFFLKDGRQFRKTIIEWVPNKYFEPALKFFYELDRRLQTYLVNLVLDCVLVGLLVGVGSAIVGAPHPVVLGLITCLFNSIPILGRILYGVAGLMITVGAGAGTEVIVGFMFVFGLSWLCDDLIFVPTIYGKSHQIHPIIVVCALFLGETLAGAWGMFLAIPIVSVLFLGLDILREISMGEDNDTLPPSAFTPFT